MMAVSHNEQRAESGCLMTIDELINEKTVFILEKQCKRDVLDALVSKAVESGFVKDVGAFKAAIDAREAVCSTAIGDEIAIPHAKIPGINSFFVMTALVHPAVEWDAPDQKHVSLVFLIGGPDNDQSTYLRLLGKILRGVKNTDTKELILRSKNAADIAQFFT